MSRHRRQRAARRKQTKTPRAGGEFEERKSLQRTSLPEPAFDLPPPKWRPQRTEKTVVSEGATCYICLHDGPDEEGKPLVRDCSCRGDSAGFAHLSCLVDCAEHKSKDIACFGGTAEIAWMVCPHCEQRYQDKLAKDMSRAFLSFAEKSHRERDYLKQFTAKKEEETSLSQSPCCKQSHQNRPCKDASSAVPSCGEKNHRKLDRLQIGNGENEQVTSPSQNPWFPFFSQLRVMDAMKAYTASHGTVAEDPLIPWMVGKDAIANRVLSIVERLKKDTGMTDEWLHLPKDSLGYSMYRLLRGRYEAYGYCELGNLSFHEGTAAGYKRAIGYMERARIISMMLDKERMAERYQCRIDFMRHMREGTSSAMEVSRKTYESQRRAGNEFSPLAIRSGLRHVWVLEAHGRVAEAMALATKLATSSRRVNGPQHFSTVSAENLLKDLVKIHGREGTEGNVGNMK